jgi:Protein of unknown function (DUF3800)
VLNLFRAYLDESYGDRVFSIGGFFGPDTAWEDFNTEWSSALARFELTEFHSNHWENLKGEFKGWTSDKKIALIQELATIINSNEIAGVHSAVSLRDFRKIFPLDKPDAPYFLCFQSCVAEAAYWSGQKRQQVSFWFDQQKQVEFRANRLFNHVKTADSWVDRCWLGSLTFAGSKLCLPLQAADFLAYEGFKHLDNELLNSNRPMRKPMKLLYGQKQLSGRLWNAESLEELKLELKDAAAKGIVRMVPVRKGEAK